ncbi:hypothetical protein WJX81_004623 [Elliptochloris bilobata]|uniref:DUF866 domain-containing protein n=1 Tax=Elliptochloris bilobata TaxID=381761 RepID=A0AAW1S6W9_9CHLO
MVLVVLYMKANLENVVKISLPEGHTFCLDVKDSTGDDVREGVRVSSADDVELPGSRGSANFALKWVRDARHPAHLTLAPLKGVTRPYSAADDGKWVGVVGMECRGLEPIRWQPEAGFCVETPSGTVFEDVDLSEDWAEYDEKAGTSVGVYELESKFEAVKS